jgi:hypothetical protein
VNIQGTFREHQVNKQLTSHSAFSAEKVLKLSPAKKVNIQ